jgi:hypothetical protein
MVAVLYSRAVHHLSPLEWTCHYQPSDSSDGEVDRAEPVVEVDDARIWLA